MDINEKKVILIYEDETIMEWARWIPDEGMYERHPDILKRIIESNPDLPDVHEAVIIFEFKRNSEYTIFIPKVTHDYQKDSLNVLMPYEEGMRYRAFVRNQEGSYSFIDNENQQNNYADILKIIDERIARNRG